MAVKRNLSDVELASIGGRLRFLRARSQETQAQVASSVGVHPVQLSEWEGNKWVPKAEALHRLAAHYGAPSEWIVKGGPVPNVKTSLVPRGTTPFGSAGDHRPLEELARDFEVEMIQAGATRFEADHIQERLTAFWSAPIFDGGETAASLTPEDQKREFRLYMEYSLRPWILERIAMRSTKRPRHQTIVEDEVDAPSSRASARLVPAPRKAAGGRPGRRRHEP